MSSTRSTAAGKPHTSPTSASPHRPRPTSRPNGSPNLASTSGPCRGRPSIYRVRKARTSHRLYAEKVTVHDHDGEKHVEFAYNAKAIAFLRKDKLTWLEARDFGAAYGACVACGRTLSDPRSLVQQYGSTCAGHFGWPTVTKKQAEAIIEGVLTWDDVVAGLGVLTS